MKDEENFNDISIIPRDEGIEVKLGNAKAVLLNRDDAQFLCDNLYILLDEMELDDMEEGDDEDN